MIPKRRTYHENTKCLGHVSVLAGFCRACFLTFRGNRFFRMPYEIIKLVIIIAITERLTMMMTMGVLLQDQRILMEVFY